VRRCCQVACPPSAAYHYWSCHCVCVCAKVNVAGACKAVTAAFLQHGCLPTPRVFACCFLGLAGHSLGHTCHPFSQLVLVVTMAPKRNGIHSQRIDNIRALRRQAQQELRTLRTDLKKDRADDRSARIHALGVFVLKTGCEFPSSVLSFCTTI
jgi:hypothetical protein